MTGANVIALSLLLAITAQSAELENLSPGLWVQPGYASVLQLTEDEVIQFDVTPISCFESERLPRSDLYMLFREHNVSSDPGRMILHDEGIDYHFEELDQLPDHCVTQETSAAEDFEVLVHYFDSMYPSFSQRGVDWTSMVKAERRTLGSDANQTANWDSIERLLSALNDSHVFANNAREGEESRVIRSAGPAGLKQWVARTNPNLAAGEQSTIRKDISTQIEHSINTIFLNNTGKSALRDNLIWGRVASNVGYLKVRKFTGYLEHSVKVIDEVLDAADVALDQALKDLEGVDAIIIDLSRNPGGNSVVAQRMASHFILQTVSFNVSVPANKGFSPQQKIEIKPSSGKVFKGEIFLLVSGDTISAAELFALLLNESKKVTLIGETTRGSFSEFYFKLLPSGGYVGIPNMLVMDANDRTFEGSGIEPDIMHPLFEEGAPVTNMTNAINFIVAQARSPCH